MLEKEKYIKVNEIRVNKTSEFIVQISLLVGIPLLGILLYFLVIRPYYIDRMIAWYYQLIIGIIIYVLNCVVHELIHGLFYKLFNPDKKVTFKFAIFGSATSMEKAEFSKIEFIIVLLAPMLFLTIFYLVLAFLIPKCFGVFFITSFIGFASGNNDLLVALKSMRMAKRKDIIIDGGKYFEVYRKKEPELNK